MVTNSKLLAGMAKEGFILWEPGIIVKHWTGQKIRKVFVDAGPKLARWSDPFTYRGKNYRLRYVDGCVHPFVFGADAQIPDFV